MKVYIAANSSKGEAREEIDSLSRAVRDAKMQDFCFTRDVEHYKKDTVDTQKRWMRIRDEIIACDAFLIEESSLNSDEQFVEMGIAHARLMPIIVVKKHGTANELLFDGVATVIIDYEGHKDLVKQLKDYDSERNFGTNDRMTMLVSILAIGAIVAVLLGRFFIPLAVLWLFIYWFIVRYIFSSMRAFDRVVIYIPLTALWLGGLYVLMPIYMPLAVAWGLGFWVVTVLILNKLKFSL